MQIQLTDKDLERILTVIAVASEAIDAGLMPKHDDGSELFTRKQAKKAWKKSFRLFKPLMRGKTEEILEDLSELPEPLQKLIHSLVGEENITQLKCFVKTGQAQKPSESED